MTAVPPYRIHRYLCHSRTNPPLQSYLMSDTLPLLLRLAVVDYCFVGEVSRLPVVVTRVVVVTRIVVTREGACATNTNPSIRFEFGLGIAVKNHSRIAPALSTGDLFSDGPLSLINRPIS